VAIVARVFLLVLALSSCAEDSGPEWASAEVLDEAISEFARVGLAMDDNGGAMAIWPRTTERG
jgi:hypothetical protein